jgi:chemotaxis protein methyltransferase CheR
MQEYTQNYLRAGRHAVVLGVLHGGVRRGAVLAVAAARRGVRAAQPGDGPVVQRVQRDPLPERDDLLRPSLQNRVHELFYESLPTYGILALGSKESLKFSKYEDCYERSTAREDLPKVL